MTKSKEMKGSTRRGLEENEGDEEKETRSVRENKGKYGGSRSGDEQY